MKKFTKLAAVIATLAMGLVLGACSINVNAPRGNSSAAEGTVVAKYKGQLTGDAGSPYVNITLYSNGTWKSQGYTDSNYSTTSQEGTITNGTAYTINGNNVVITSTMFGGISMTATPAPENDVWPATLTVTGNFSGTVIKF